MLILDWMKPHVITVVPDTSLLQCRKLLKDNRINYLPVVDRDNIVVGLIASADLKAFAPQHTTGFEILEALDILAETKVKDVMVVAPVTIHYNNTVEQAAKTMFDRHVACLPVIDDEDKLVGIITGWDIFHALLNMSGAEQGGEEAGFVLPNQPGTIREILDTLKTHGMSVISVLSAAADNGMRQVKIRFRAQDAAALDDTFEILKQHSGLRYWARDGKVHMKD
ncbi:MULTISPECIES: CBS and ACT domain-containing protein [Desulfovibrio]|uniref:Acetoin utilization protein AcuB n=3 Tax=Desulfovibrio TaxID=872 RepID=A0AA94HSK7_DESDE|nr:MULTISPECIES: CBS and ACT domain-containing protein [Desulfovibrio]ATD80889.1 CBS domain-containing protein [Desulfovibrio sp. G11]SFW45873.1 acetoin utilization protein AcuB [Desulfovibrio desulfuricans]SPD36446.1 CBS domain [Desulfovibrio sp. G11]